MTISPTGIQYELRDGEYSAVVTEVGAALRSLKWGGDELLWTFEADENPKGFAGVTLGPWPNRLRDGKFFFDGEEYQAPINEVEINNALHGLMCATPYALVHRSPNEVTLKGMLYPQIGWDWVLSLEMSYQLSNEGLQVSFLATNEGTKDLPYGYGTHPYFGFENVDDVTITAPFTKRCAVDERLLPTAIVDVEGVHSRHVPTTIGDTFLDDAYTGAEGGAWTLTMAAPERTVTMWADEQLPWCQMHTRPGRVALAVEPMTCGPDAFNEGPTHDGLIRLAPGESTTGTWGVSVG